jgi:hypothetical protein
MSRTCRMFDSASELGMAVMKSLTNEMRINPREGWVPAQQAKSLEDYENEKGLRHTLAEVQKENEQLRRELRDGTLDIEGYLPENLAQGIDRYQLKIAFNNRSKQYVVANIAPTWNEIFSAVGPSMYGYIIRKHSGYPNDRKYPFHDALEHLFRSYVFEEVQSRKIDISDADIDTIIIQFKQLGYIKFHENTENDGEVFRGITLTELGELKLTQIKAQISSLAT